MNYLYEYVLEIAKDPKYNVMKVYKYEIIAENEEQYVYKCQNIDRYSIHQKEKNLYAKFYQVDWLYKVPHYSVRYYTTEKGKRAESIVKKALKKLVDETCFITDIVENLKIEFKEV